MKPRPISELLQILLDNFDSIFSEGLCYTIHLAYVRSFITFEEKCELEHYIHYNRPKYNFFSAVFNDVLPPERTYYWKKNEKKPRIKWLKEHIKKTKKLNI